MKKFVYLLTASIVFNACGGSEETNPENGNTQKDSLTTQETVVPEVEPVPQNSFLLEPGLVGVFKIGHPLGTLPAELSSRKSAVAMTVKGVTEDHVQYVIFNSLEDVTEIFVEKNDELAEEDLVIIKMRVISNYYETKEGIKVGSSIGELTGKFPDVKFRYNGETGEVMGETKTLDGMQFVINPSYCKKKTSGTKDITLNPSNFTEDAKIEYINVY